ncbi:MAG: hypothetical protein JWM76_5196 [Pseudonocardiales bacterium]|nr:hypothetical protein [Pseudonocardiales bacterium]
MSTNNGTPGTHNGSTPTDASVNSGAYVLNALDPSETIEFEAHLEGSDTLRNEVTELSDTAVLLGMAVAPVQPSAELKTNIMAMLASTPQLTHDIAPVRTLKAVPQLPVEQADTTEFAPAPVTGAHANRAKARWFNRPIVALTAVAAAFALVVGGGVIANMIPDNTSQQAQADVLAAITSASDKQEAQAAVSTGGTATLVWSEEVGKSALITNGLADLPDDKTYELWYIDASGATPAGLLDNDSTWRVLDGEMSNGLTIGVTVEPNGGSDAPTTEPIVAIASA